MSAITVEDLIHRLSQAKNKKACVSIRIYRMADANLTHASDETVPGAPGDEIGMFVLYVEPSSEMGLAGGMSNLKSVTDYIVEDSCTAPDGRANHDGGDVYLEDPLDKELRFKATEIMRGLRLRDRDRVRITIEVIKP